MCNAADLGGAVTSRAGCAYQPRACQTYRAPWHPRPHIADYVDTVNIMAYDAANITFDHEKILQNFVSLGVPKEKVFHIKNAGGAEGSDHES